MSPSRLGSVFIGAGAALATAGAAGLMAGVRVELPPELVALMFYKLVFLGAGGLMVVGALVRRYTLERRGASAAPAEAVPPHAPPGRSPELARG